MTPGMMFIARAAMGEADEIARKGQVLRAHEIFPEGLNRDKNDKGWEMSVGSDGASGRGDGCGQKVSYSERRCRLCLSLWKPGQRGAQPFKR